AAAGAFRRGRCGRARRSSSRRDQLVVSRERTSFDVGLALAPALAAQLIQRALVGGIGEAKAAGEGAPVAAGELARVQREGADLALAGGYLDPPPPPPPGTHGS